MGGFKGEIVEKISVKCEQDIMQKNKKYRASLTKELL